MRCDVEHVTILAQSTFDKYGPRFCRGASPRYGILTIAPPNPNNKKWAKKRSDAFFDDVLVFGPFLLAEWPGVAQQNNTATETVWSYINRKLSAKTQSV
jgi:hypothetical protein